MRVTSVRVTDWNAVDWEKNQEDAGKVVIRSASAFRYILLFWRTVKKWVAMGVDLETDWKPHTRFFLARKDFVSTDFE